MSPERQVRTFIEGTCVNLEDEATRVCAVGLEAGHGSEKFSDPI